MSLRKEDFTYSLALIIISSYIVFFAVIMYQSPSTSIEDLKTIAATFGTIVAAIIGYYFGQRPTEIATKSAQDNRTKRQKEAGADITEIKDGLNSWIANRDYLRTLISKLGEQ